MSDVFRSEYREMSPETARQIEIVKTNAGVLLSFIECLPPSRERSLAVTKLEECVMWATKAATRVDE